MTGEKLDTGKLTDAQLGREVGAKPGMPVLRRDDEGSLYALVITKLGRAAIDAKVSASPIAA